MVDEAVKRFTYSARNNQGDLVSGIIQSDSETGAARRLQSQGLAPLSLQLATAGNRNIGSLDLVGMIKGPKRIGPKHLALFARQFATMTDAGLPLVRSINVLAGQTDHPELKRVLPLVRNEVEAGVAFSTALNKYPGVFPPLMIGMVAAGEVSGSLAISMEQVADNYEKEAKLRAKVVSALTYPVIVLIMAALMVTFMMLFVIPKFVDVFKNLGGPLPVPTQILVNISAAAVYWVPAVLIFIFGYSIWWRIYKNNVKVRNVVDPIKLKLPILGKFGQKISIARFARTFASLLTSGVPMIQTLDIVAATAGSVVVTNALLHVRNSVRAGKPVNVEMANHKIFPPLLVQMISTGEETGALAPMLIKVAQYYEADVDATSETLSATLEPVLLVFLAVIVGSMIIALYLPIFSVYQYIK